MLKGADDPKEHKETDDPNVRQRILGFIDVHEGTLGFTNVREGLSSQSVIRDGRSLVHEGTI